MTGKFSESPAAARRPRETKARRPLRDTVAEIDRDILRLLLRRATLLAKMRGARPSLDAAEEKGLREAWETAVAKVSRDPRLSAHFFSLMQSLEFLPRPGEAAPALTAFNLAPSPRPVRLRLAAPVDSRATRAWLMLAAASGQAVRIMPCLQNDAELDFMRMLDHAGASVFRDGGGFCTRPASPLAAPDKVLHVGESVWNLYLLLAHYLGRPSRAKFTGDAGLKLADLSPVRHFLPALGARLVPVVPKSEGLPARLECSGMLPDAVSLPADVPVALAEAILLAAPGYERPLALDLSALPGRESALVRTLPLLDAAGADVTRQGDVVALRPCVLRVPERPVVPMAQELALFLLALPLVLGGEACLEGQFPASPEALAGLNLLRLCERVEEKDGTGLVAHARGPLAALPEAWLDGGLPAGWTPLALALAACAALRGGSARLPQLPEGADAALAESYLRAVGVELDGEGVLRKNSQTGARPVWNAPDAVWAMALALAACASPHLKLGNPGVMTSLYPGFWALYNGLPAPDLAQREPASAAEPVRRRIITGAVAVPPEWQEEE